MKEYYFLFVIAFIFTFFASIQDLRKREVANWLNFSLIAFTLTYRVFYSIIKNDFKFIIFGLAGFGIFFILSHIFYYSKAFAGGDAKLLMALGVILPYSDIKSFIYLPLLFVFLLFLIGAGYSIVYSFFIVYENKNKFIKEFKHYLRRYKFIAGVSLILFVISLLFLKSNSALLSLTILLLMPILFIYTKSLEKSMIKIYNYNKLTEGDWLVKDVVISRGLTIKRTVHGLTLKDIKLLKKYRKNVLIKEGIPFVPAFLLTLIVLGVVYFFNLKFEIFSFLNMSRIIFS